MVACTHHDGRRYALFSAVSPQSANSTSVPIRVTVLGLQIIDLRPRHSVRCRILVGVGKTQDRELAVAWVSRRVLLTFGGDDDDDTKSP